MIAREPREGSRPAANFLLWGFGGILGAPQEDLAYHGTKQACLVALRGFTPGAHELAESTNVRLLDLAAIRKLLLKD